MIRHRTNKFSYCCWTVFAIFSLNILQTNAGVSDIFREMGNVLQSNEGVSNFLREMGNVLQNNEGVSNLLRDTGLAPDVPASELVKAQADLPAMARIFYSAIGDLVETVPVFPITFNVPDMVSAFGGLLSGMFNYITGNTNTGESQPKDVLGTMINIYRHIAVQEDIHDFEFMT